MFNWFPKRSDRKPVSAIPEDVDFPALLAEADKARDIGHAAEAERLYSKLLAADPKNTPAMFELAGIRETQLRFAEAADLCKRGLAIKPAQIGLLARLGSIASKIGDYSLAAQCFEAVYKQDPAFPWINDLLAEQYSHLGENKQTLAALERAMLADPSGETLTSARLFNWNFYQVMDRERLFQEHRKWGALVEQSVRNSWLPHENLRDPDRPLTIGYVSADLREHAVAFFIEGVLAAHDRSQFKVICFDVSHRPADEVMARLRASVPIWRQVADLSDDALADTIRNSKVDILVDLSGHTSHNRLAVFARRPAPVQVSWFGYMNTTGLTTMDYRITDAYVDPPGESDRFFTETLFRIPAMACFTPHPKSPAINELPALRSPHFTFGAVNQWTKVTEEMKLTWVRVLSASDKFRLLIVARGAHNEQFRKSVFENLESLGANLSQIQLVPALPLLEFLALFGKIDVALDTYPYCGGTTTLHTLWMGVPVVTQDGAAELSRSASGILRAIGCGEFVAKDSTEYYNIAVAAANDIGRIAKLRSELRPRMERSPLTDNISLTRNLEHAYRAMWRNYCIGRKEVLEVR